MTGWTIVEHEPEWNDTERQHMLDLATYEAGLHKCGHHRSIVNSDDHTFTPDEFICQVCAAQERRDRRERAEEEATAKALGHGSTSNRPSDGRDTYMRLMSPEEAAEAAAERARRRAYLDTHGTTDPSPESAPHPVGQPTGPGRLGTHPHRR